MITILGQVPSKSNGYKIGNNRLYKSNELKEYEQRFIWQYATAIGRQIDTIKEKFAYEILVFFQ